MLAEKGCFLSQAEKYVCQKEVMGFPLFALLGPLGAEARCHFKENPKISNETEKIR